MTASTIAALSGRYKSKTLAAWAALLGGSWGLHRFYLYGLRDRWAWVHPWPTLLGLWGVRRIELYGVDDPWSWVLLPILGSMLAGTMLMAIVYGLMPDERWNQRFNPDNSDTVPASGWGAIFAVVLALLVGATVLMATIAYSGQHFFEHQYEEARKISQ